MAERKTGDPKDGAPHVGGRRFVPVHGLYGVASVLPGPVTPGRPKPEPDERWTLAPVPEPAPPAGEGDGASQAVPVEPVRSPESRPVTGSDEPDRA